jgi:hypothetical protein
MRRIFFVIALAILAFACQANSSEPIKSVGMHFGVFSPADWRIQETYFPGSYYNFIGPGTGLEVDGSFAFIYDYWRFRLESGYRWHSNGYFYDTGFESEMKIESEMKVVPIRASISRKIPSLLCKSSVFIGAGTGLNIASFKSIQTETLLGGDKIITTIKDNTIVPELFMLAGFDIPLTNKFFIDAEIRYSYSHSDWKLEGDGQHPVRLDDVNIGGTTMQIGLERRF